MQYDANLNYRKPKFHYKVLSKPNYFSQSASGYPVTEKYEKFEKLKIKAKELQEMSNGSFPLLENVKEEILCYKEMYKLAKEKKASRIFILKEIMDKGFDAALQGYLISVKFQKSENCPPTGYLMS